MCYEIMRFDIDAPLTKRTACKPFNQVQTLKMVKNSVQDIILNPQVIQIKVGVDAHTPALNTGFQYQIFQIGGNQVFHRIYGVGVGTNYVALAKGEIKTRILVWRAEKI